MAFWLLVDRGWTDRLFGHFLFSLNDLWVPGFQPQVALTDRLCQQAKEVFNEIRHIAAVFRQKDISHRVKVGIAFSGNQGRKTYIGEKMIS